MKEMIKIHYMADDFPKKIYGKQLSGSHTLFTDWHEVIWAAITVGKRNTRHITKHGIYSAYEIINRAMLIWTSLKLESNFLQKTDVYKEMDPTEKVFVSFSLGMTMSKLLACRLLGVHWLQHVAYVNKNISTRKTTRSRPDLIGLNKRHDFVVFEAKGRSNKYDDAAQITAKNQTKVISKISGRYPVLRVACQSYFDENLRVYIQDPEDISINSLEVETDLNHYLKGYYSLFDDLDDVNTTFLKSIGIEIDFSESLSLALKKESFYNFRSNIEQPEFDKYDFKCFPDGIKIKLNNEIWSNERLSLEPKNR